MNKGYKSNSGISKSQVIELIVKEVAKIQTGGLDLSTYAKKSEVSAQISNAVESFLTEAEIQVLLEALDIPTKVSELQNDSNLVNETYVNNAINAKKHYTEEEIRTIVEGVLAEKETTGGINEEAVQTIINESLSQLNIPTKTSQLTNDSDFITGSEVDSKIANASLGGEVDLTSYAKKTELADKVDKIEGKSLISNTEIQRLATLKNYDDTEIRTSLNNKVDKEELVVLSATNGNASITLSSLHSIVITNNTTINLPTINETYWGTELYIKGQKGNIITLKQGTEEGTIELDSDKQHVLKIVKINGEFNIAIFSY